MSVKRFIVIAVSLFSTVSLWAQSHTESDFLTALDRNVTKMDSELFRGELYVEKHPVRNDKHKFFGDGSFSTGDVVFGDQSYYNVRLKYDVYGDELLAHHDELPITMAIQLDKSRVRQFKLFDITFINISITTNKNEEFSGFAEVFYNGDRIQVLKKHLKKIYRRLEGKLFFEFKNDAAYFLVYNGEYYQIKKIKGLREILPNHRDEIQTLINQHKTSKKNDFENSLLQIVTKLDILLAKNENVD